MPTPRPHRRILPVLLATLLVVTGAAAACSSDSDVANSDETTTGPTSVEPTVSGVWARAATNLEAQDKSAVYLTIEGGGRANALVGASVPADVATTVEIHETVAATADSAEGAMTTTTSMSGSSDTTSSTAMTPTTAMGEGGPTSDMMQMRPVEKIEIPADGQVELAPGGLHIMLIGLQRALQPGDSIEVTLNFEQGDPLTVTATVRGV